ncbi:MAG TPA: isoprenyl transferase [Bacteroidia bacterium]|jgi:undecaprenyl diphosphate synthase|nr:isoprenyl transferase [Bacteroidia bacterium]
MSWKEKIDKNRLPQHVAVIMDGNGRWAAKHGKERVFGHRNGVNAVRETAEAAAEIGVKYVTLYAFSTENWNRPKEEVDALMQLLVHTISEETKTLNENSIRLATIGDTNSLPESCRKELQEAINNTSTNSRMTLTLALSYSSRWEIVEAAKKLAEEVKSGKISVDQITAEKFSSALTTNAMPDPELLIRTSGEHRVSNYLLWQLAYAEFYFTDVLWPDFNKEEFYKAIVDYQGRERRFGKTSEQIINEVLGTAGNT